MKGQSRADSGFTVLELLVTIGIAMVVMGIAISSFLSWLPTLRLSSAARQVATDLHLARMKAISQNTNFQIAFNGSSYVVQRCAGTCTNDSGDIALPEGIAVLASGSPLFLPRGTAASDATITLSNGVESKQVLVSIVGRVKIL